jgi:hypothetical protein
MVRDSIARLGAGSPSPVSDEPLRPAGSPGRVDHASHHLLPLARGGDLDGACLIEPTVRCNHCGYCLSYGH